MSVDHYALGQLDAALASAHEWEQRANLLEQTLAATNQAAAHESQIRKQWEEYAQKLEQVILHFRKHSAGQNAVITALIQEIQELDVFDNSELLVEPFRKHIYDEAYQTAKVTVSSK